MCNGFGENEKREEKTEREREEEKKKKNKKKKDIAGGNQKTWHGQQPLYKEEEE